MCSINRALVLAIICLIFLHELEVCTAKLHEHRQLKKKQHNKQNNKFIMGAQINCKGKCDERCKEASRYRMCVRGCNTCCQRCNCVPPGTSGNAETCPCWNNMTTTSGKKKCP